MILFSVFVLAGGVLFLLANIHKPCSVYLAQPMSGYDKEEMIQLAKLACFIARQYGLKPWSPVLHEGIRGKGDLKVDGSLSWKWPMDKKALNGCFCFVNLRADEKSFGCEDEYGRQRYSEWQASFRISPKHAAGYKSIANYQSDGVFGDMHTCFKHISDTLGTLPQRQMFKLKIWATSGIPWLVRQIMRLTQ